VILKVHLEAAALHMGKINLHAPLDRLFGILQSLKSHTLQILWFYSGTL